MKEKLKGARLVDCVLVAAGLVVIIAGMRAAAPILIPFLLSLFIAVICAIPMLWLQRVGVPRWLAVCCVIAGIVVLGFVLVALLGTSIGDFSRNLPSYQERLMQGRTVLLSWLDERGVDIPAGILLDRFDPGALMRLISRMLSGLGGILTNAFLIFLTVSFILLEASSFPAKLRSVLKNPDESLGEFERVTKSIRRYLAIKTMTSIVTGVFITVWLAMFGVDYPVLWGLLAFMLNYVPSIGSIIAAGPGILMALIQFGPAKAILVTLGYLFVNVVIGNIVEPRVMGRGLGLSPLVVFLSLVFWGWALGPVGMLLSVLLTMIVKIALEQSEETRWIATLLGSEATVKSASSVGSKAS